LSYPKRPRTKK